MLLPMTGNVGQLIGPLIGMAAFINEQCSESN